MEIQILYSTSKDDTWLESAEIEIDGFLLGIVSAKRNYRNICWKNWAWCYQMFSFSENKTSSIDDYIEFFLRSGEACEER
jgi:hypothetical protein